ncbi:hypothetical protein IGI04_032185, partial [Brassica rapa subsp. trilocularis]
NVPNFAPFTLKSLRRNRSIIVKVEDADGGGPDEYDEEVEEVDNKKDYDVEYDPTLAASGGAGDGDIAFVQSKSFVSTQGINEDEFHKISLLDCDFFIRKPPDPENDVYDFREMYVTPPDTDIYSIPRVLAPVPQKVQPFNPYWLLCFGTHPLYKSEREISKVFLTKHYRNRRSNDPEFVLALEEIYVIDSKSKSITRARVLVTVPGGRKRDRKDDLLVIRDNENSFKIIHVGERDDPTTVIEREEWTKTREDMEKHLRKLRDFSVSNWF